MSNFPTSLPASKENYDNNTLIASADQNAQGSDINAIAAKVGIDGSADTSSLDYKINNIATLDVATGAEVNTGTDDLKYVTPKAVADSNVAFIADIPVKATGAETNVGTNDAKFVTPLASMTAKTTVTAYAPAGAGTTTLDLSLGDIFRVTMPATTQTLAISNASVGQEFVVEIVNTASQGALTWFSTITWARDGLAPPLTGTATKIDTYRFRVTSAGNYLGYDDSTYVKTTAAQTLTNKTLTSPVINTPTGDVATITGTQTLTNKTLTSPVLNTPTYSANAVLNITAKAKAYSNSAQDNLTNNTPTKVNLDAEVYDTGSNFSGGTFTIPVTGLYLVSGKVTFINVIANKSYRVDLYINGASNCVFMSHSGLADTLVVGGATIFSLSATNTLELYAVSISGGNTVDIQPGVIYTSMDIQLLA